MIYDKDGWLVEVDLPRTCSAYEKLAHSGQFGTQCNCLHCQNLNAHIVSGAHPGVCFPEDLIALLASFGVDYRIAGEFYSNYTLENRIFYHGFYSIYGVIKTYSTLGTGAIFFENNSPLGRSDFPDENHAILLGISVELPLLEKYQEQNI